MRPYCFVLMPFGEKPDDAGRMIDFDHLYTHTIHPAIRSANLDPIRADEEIIGGIIHKPMFEKLMLCDYAVADLTTANANVLYELGIRHGGRPHSTVLMAARGTRLPFDVQPLRALLYELTDSGKLATSEATQEALTQRLVECRNPSPDSPLFQLITDMPCSDLSHLKTDRFRELVDYSQQLKDQLVEARTFGVEAVRSIDCVLTIEDTDPAVLVDLLLSYRAVDAHEWMLDLFHRLPPLLQRATMVREQLGFALNRLGRREEAERTLRAIIDENGPSSETNGLLGRVYKDTWKHLMETGTSAQTTAYLRKAIDTYIEGFEADWRDAYPGVNAVTLMEISDTTDHRQDDLVAVVRYSAQRRLKSQSANYWDYATLLELHVISNDCVNARQMLLLALPEIEEAWQPQSTAHQIKQLRESKARRGLAIGWIEEIEKELQTASATLRGNRDCH